MSGYQSRVIDAINQAAPTFSTASVEFQGLAQFIDSSLTGDVRFMQKSGFPNPLLTPQMSDTLEATAAAGTKLVTLTSIRIASWLTTATTISIGQLEDHKVESVTTNGMVTTVTLVDNVLITHDAGTVVTISGFDVLPGADYASGTGTASDAPVQVLSPYFLIIGDTFRVGGKTFTVLSADKTGVSSGSLVFDVRVDDPRGLPEILTSSVFLFDARPAYQSRSQPLPYATSKDSGMVGPIVLDWVSSPMVSDLQLDVESQVTIEEQSASGRVLVPSHTVNKNDVLTRMPINRDQMLFWNAVEGGVNWDGKHTVLKAFDSGRAHLRGAIRPPLDPAPIVTATFTIPIFPPYRVILLDRVISGSVTIVDTATGVSVPSSDYAIDYSLGHIDFIAARASTEVFVSYRPMLSWTLGVIPNDTGIEVCVKVGSEPKQVFVLGASGAYHSLDVLVSTQNVIDDLNITIRKSDDAIGPFSVKLSDWQPRGESTAMIKYTISTSAVTDYDWASSGLMIKALWPSIDLLRAKLDGTSSLSRYLDSGKLLV